MKGLILAGGIGRRLYPLTKDKPKCMLKVGDKTILEHLLDNFSYAGFKEVIVVSGFNSELVKSTIGDSWNEMKITHCVNEDFAKTNTRVGLLVAKDHINCPIVQCHGDLIFNKEMLKRVLESSIETGVVGDSDLANLSDDDNRFIMNDGKVIDLNKTHPKEDSKGRSVGIYKFSKEAAETYFKHISNFDDDYKTNFDGFEVPLRKTFLEHDFGMIDVKGIKTMEVDNPEDLENAHSKIDEILGFNSGMG